MGNVINDMNLSGLQNVLVHKLNKNYNIDNKNNSEYMYIKLDNNNKILDCDTNLNKLKYNL